jgi:hypothetical protein
MTRWSFCILTALVIAAVLVLGTGVARPASEEELWRHRNLGKALFEAPDTMSKAPAELKKALDLAPDSHRDRLNYGIALLRNGELDAAIVELEKAQKLNPDLPYSWFNLGIAYKRKGRRGDALRQFEHMVQMTPDEPVVHYNIGLLYDLAGRSEEALKQYELAARLDPKLVGPRFKIFNYYRLKGDVEAATRARAEFERAKQAQQEHEDSEDLEWCYYAELYDPITARPAGRNRSPAVELKVVDHPLPGTVDAATAGLLAISATGERAADLLVWSRSGIELYRRGAEHVPQTGLSGIRDVVSVAAGDFDNDGLLDLCVLTGAGARLYRNVNGRFEPLDAQLPQEPFTKVVWLDYDHDYDVDLFLLGARSVLMRNEGQSRFRDYSSHFPFAPGRAIDGVSFRVMPDTKGIDLAVSYADRKSVLYRDELRGVFKATPLDAIPLGATALRAADVDNNGWLDLAFRMTGGVALAVNREGKFEAQQTPASGPFAFLDFENRGFLDLAGGRAVYRNEGLTRFGPGRMLAEAPPAVVLTAADFDGDGRADLACVSRDGGVHLLLNRTAANNQWLRVSLKGVKNVKAGAGAEVEVKAGDLYQKKIYRGAPLVFGLNDHTIVDTVRITWPNGMIQNQPNEAAGRAAVYEEAPRMSGSCPMIFTWNGREFEFITDVLGVAPLGASAGDGEYFPVDHDEYVQIPAEALKAKHGRYEVRITEELHEVSYIDQVRLFALDHPSDVQVFTNEKFKGPPFPEFRLFGVKRARAPVAAHDDRGRSVLPQLVRRDGAYAGGFTHDFAGVAEMHALTLDFGADAARANKAVLLLNGWVDWADGSTFFAASQSGRAGLTMPYLQVKDAAGAWRTVIGDMGIPAGKPKTIAVDLSGKFLSASREVRIVTNLCVYWDQIFLSEDAGAPEARLTGLDASSADLRLRGFSRPVIDARRERPESFLYAAWSSSAPWDQTPGMYTRYGDVRALTQAIDDRMVIMGAGDELALSFEASGLPPLRAGWTREFLLLVDGWAKDSDANTAFSQTVEPLPFHGMSSYPYPPSEHYPDDAAHRAYRAEYNTRRAMRFVESLVARRRAER